MPVAEAEQEELLELICEWLKVGRVEVVVVDFDFDSVDL